MNAVDEFFWSNVEKKEYCWLWRGQRSISGYGCFFLENICIPAHVYIIEKTHDISKVEHIRHICWNRHCVNPKHLEIKNYGLLGENLQNKQGQKHLSNDQIIAIQKDNRKQKEIAAAYGITQARISQIKNSVVSHL